MQDIHLDSLPREPGEFVRRLTALLGDASGVRIVRTSAGHTAVVMDHGISIDDDALAVNLTDPGDSRRSLALVLSDDGIRAADLEQSIDELAGISDLAAVPAGIVPQTPEKYVSVGRIEQRLDDSIATEFVIVKRVLSVREQLLRNPPTHVGEATDNLAGRERWFKKQHSRDN
jgi:hypothetical protein